MKRNRAFAGLSLAMPHLALEVSRRVLHSVPFALVCLLAQAAFPQRSAGQAPVYEITPVRRRILGSHQGHLQQVERDLTFQTRELIGGGPLMGRYPHLINLGPHAYMIVNVGEAEKTQINQEESDLLRELCPCRTDFCIDTAFMKARPH